MDCLGPSRPPHLASSHSPLGPRLQAHGFPRVLCYALQAPVLFPCRHRSLPLLAQLLCKAKSPFFMELFRSLPFPLPPLPPHQPAESAGRKVCKQAPLASVSLEASYVHCRSCCDPTMLTVKPTSTGARKMSESHWLQLCRFLSVCRRSVSSSEQTQNVKLCLLDTSLALDQSDPVSALGSRPVPRLGMRGQ